MQTEHRLENGSLSVGLSLKGGSLTGAWAGGRAFLHPGGEAGRVCFPMVPLCNRVSGNGFSFGGRDYRLNANAADPLYLHGDGWLSDWQPVSIGRDQALLELLHHNGPFRYRAEQQIMLADDRLLMRLSVENRGREDMPFGLGFHPYFPRAGAEIRFAATARWNEGPDYLPVGRQTEIPPEVDFTLLRPLPANPQNNAYEGWDGRATVQWPGLRLDLEADSLFSSLMLYAPDSDPSFFCLEPMSHLPDALNQPGQPAMIVLAPGEVLSAGISMNLINERN